MLIPRLTYSNSDIRTYFYHLNMIFMINFSINAK